MRKWEYTEIVFEFIGSPLYAVVRDGKDLGITNSTERKKNYPKFRNYLNQLGKEGWELVIILQNRAYMKRLVEEPAERKELPTAENP